MKATVWSRDNCPYCTMAIELLKLKGIETEVRKIGDGWTREQLLESIPGARSVPQILLDGELIGGYDALKTKLQVAA